MIDSLHDRFQSANRAGHITETAVPRVLHDILCSTDRGDLVLLVPLDRSPTFNTIDHCMLLKRLQDEVGISDWLNTLIVVSVLSCR